MPTRRQLQNPDTYCNCSDTLLSPEERESTQFTPVARHSMIVDKIRGIIQSPEFEAAHASGQPTRLDDVRATPHEERDTGLREERDQLREKVQGYDEANTPKYEQTGTQAWPGTRKLVEPSAHSQREEIPWVYKTHPYVQGVEGSSVTDEHPLGSDITLDHKELERYRGLHQQYQAQDQQESQDRGRLRSLEDTIDETSIPSDIVGHIQHHVDCAAVRVDPETSVDTSGQRLTRTGPSRMPTLSPESRESLEQLRMGPKFDRGLGLGSVSIVQPQEAEDFYSRYRLGEDPTAPKPNAQKFLDSILKEKSEQKARRNVHPSVCGICGNTRGDGPGQCSDIDDDGQCIIQEPKVSDRLHPVKRRLVEEHMSANMPERSSRHDELLSKAFEDGGLSDNEEKELKGHQEEYQSREDLVRKKLESTPFEELQRTRPRPGLWTDAYEPTNKRTSRRRFSFRRLSRR